MSFSSYSNFRTAVATWLGRADDATHFSTANIDDMVTLAESEIYRRLRVREMEASADMTVDAQSVALPTGFLSLRRIILNTATKDPVKFVPPEVFWEVWASATSGQPEVFTIEGENMLFGPAPDSSYTAKILYWKSPTSITGGTLNSLFTKNPDLFFFATLAQALYFAKDDERIPMMRAAFENALAAIRAQDRKDRTPGQVLVMRAQVVV
jgi:hypothetical protein